MNETELRGFSNFQTWTKMAYLDLSRKLEN